MITKLISKLKDKVRRELFVAGQIKTGIPFQIRALRDKNGWTQAELGERLGMTQTNISRLESPGYGKLNITTLQRLAAAFDVALVVRFVPFSRLINWIDNLSPADMAPQSFTEELDSLERVASATSVAIRTGTIQASPIIVGGTSQARFPFGSMQTVTAQPIYWIDTTHAARIRAIRIKKREHKTPKETTQIPIPRLPLTDYSNLTIG